MDFLPFDPVPLFGGAIDNLVAIAIGIALLVYGGDFLVVSAIRLADRYKVPHVVLGLTVVAFGTSAPELVVGIASALKGQTEIAIGNVMGSNICNVLLVLGIPALIYTINIEETIMQKAGTPGNGNREVRILQSQTIFMIAVTAVFILMIQNSGTISVVEGLILIGLLAFFLLWIMLQSNKANKDTGDDPLLGEFKESEVPFGLPAGFVAVVAIVMLGFGGELTVRNTMLLAASSEAITSGVVGLSVIAIGTSLPELAATLAAARRREGALAIGNIVGSNIFNILSIIGVTSLIYGKDINVENIRANGEQSGFLGGNGIIVDVGVMSAATLILAIIIFSKQNNVSRPVGLVLFLCYSIYVLHLYSAAF